MDEQNTPLLRLVEGNPEAEQSDRPVLLMIVQGQDGPAVAA